MACRNLERPTSHALSTPSTLYGFACSGQYNQVIEHSEAFRIVPTYMQRRPRRRLYARNSPRGQRLQITPAEPLSNMSKAKGSDIRGLKAPRSGVPVHCPHCQRPSPPQQAGSRLEFPCYYPPSRVTYARTGSLRSALPTVSPIASWSTVTPTSTPALTLAPINSDFISSLAHRSFVLRPHSTAPFRSINSASPSWNHLLLRDGTCYSIRPV